MTKLKNPTAFPVNMEKCYEKYQGMTLRDYFAAKAMQIILKSKLDKEMTMCKDAYETHITEQSYSVADAMLKQRESES